MSVHPVTLEPGFVPPDSYPPGASDSVIDAFVRRTGTTLPKDIQTWLAISDAPSGFLGIGSSQGERIEDIWKLFPDWQGPAVGSPLPGMVLETSMFG